MKSKNRKKEIWIVAAIVVMAINGWWFVSRGSSPQPKDDQIDVWSTWADKAGQLQELFDRYAEQADIRATAIR